MVERLEDRTVPASGLDLNYGTGGIATFNSGSTDEGFGSSIDSVGRVVVCGRAWNGSNYDIQVSRHLTNGQLDPSFGNGGKVTKAIFGFNELATNVPITLNGQVLALGWYCQTKHHFLGTGPACLARTHQTGTSTA